MERWAGGGHALRRSAGDETELGLDNGQEPPEDPSDLAELPGKAAGGGSAGRIDAAEDNELD